MLRWFQRLRSKEASPLQTAAQFAKMLEDGRRVFDRATDAYLLGADPLTVRGDLVETDQGINKLERQIRREIIVHATVYGATELPSSLVLMSITKDAERIGDYAKNILDLALFRPKKSASAYYDLLVQLREQISQMLLDAREIFASQDAEKARAYIESAEALKDVCDDAIAEILTSDEPREVEPADPAATALCFRYYKRVISHARNIVTSIVVPVDQLDYFDESKDTRDIPPPI